MTDIFILESWAVHTTLSTLFTAQPFSFPAQSLIFRSSSHLQRSVSRFPIIYLSLILLFKIMVYSCRLRETTWFLSFSIWIISPNATVLRCIEFHLDTQPAWVDLVFPAQFVKESVFSAVHISGHSHRSGLVSECTVLLHWSACLFSWFIYLFLCKYYAVFY